MNEIIRTAAISPLRQRMIDDMAVRGFAPTTQRNYIRDVARFATFLRRSPDTATRPYLACRARGRSSAGYKARDSSSIVPTRAKSGRPYFAHLAMCKRDNLKDVATAGGKGKNSTIDPPLGWMLSKSTRESLRELYEHCGNKEQLEQLESA